MAGQMMRTCITLMCIIPFCLVVCSCANLERTIRHNRENNVREIVREEVPAIVEQSIGRLAMRVLPWLLGPTGVLAGGGIIAARKKKQSNDSSRM